MFNIEGEALHKLNQASQEKQFIVEIGGQQFFFTKTQVAILSPIAFKHSLHQNSPFKINFPPDLNFFKLIECFEMIYSLFHSTAKVTILFKSLEYFIFLADFLDNRFLMEKCKKLHQLNLKISNSQL
jgi:hypothetical protein